jgi:spore photoproduct lyase
MKDLNIKKVIIEKGASGQEFTQHILRRLPGIPVQTINEIDSKAIPDETNMGKETLHLLPYKGEFLKPCPGTREYICCGYQILNVATNCPLDCSYCILQSYFKQPYLKAFVNLEQGVEQVLKVIDSRPDLVFRIGTGEFTDSLAIDPITRWTDWLLPLFSKRKNSVLELKTKTDNIRGLLNSPFRDRIIVSWSLNSPFISVREENRAASLRKRLEAARQCQAEGFVLGFHFDPLIPHPKWKDP